MPNEKGIKSEMDEQKAIERVKREYAYTNQYNKENYERVNAMFVKGTKERIASSGKSINAFIKEAVFEKLEREGL